MTVYLSNMVFNLGNDNQREHFWAYARSLYERKSGIVDLTDKRQRTLKSNSFLHVLLKYFASQTGYSYEWVKEKYYKELVNPDIFVVKKEDRFLGETQDLRSSADLTSEEMSLSIDRFRNWSAMEAGIYLPSADERKHIETAIADVERDKQYL